MDSLLWMDSLTRAPSPAQFVKQISITIKFLSNEANKDTGPASNFEIMVANGQIERQIGTVLLDFEVADIQDCFIVLKTVFNPRFGWCFLQNRNVLNNFRQAIITFP